MNSVVLQTPLCKHTSENKYRLGPQRDNVATKQALVSSVMGCAETETAGWNTARVMKVCSRFSGLSCCGTGFAIV
jgi:hypothetical protein